MPTSTEAKQVVREGYNALSHTYHAFIKSRPSPKTTLISSLLTTLPPSAQVLELGCGTGVPATQTLSSHLNVIGVDISPVQIELAKQHAPKATYMVGDMMELQFEDGRFDAVCAFYSVFHLPREEHGEMLRRVYRWLKPGGKLLVNLTNKADVGTVEEWLGSRMYQSGYGAEENEKLVRGAGFEIESAELLPEEGLRDLTDPTSALYFLWVVAKK
ncbi:Methyltransferase domain-containing protein 1 [Elsinoe fawcettii]|nr:Methyltransferase domain-containing protein 1 [Elsinoe fawcettii]